MQFAVMLHCEFKAHNIKCILVGTMMLRSTKIDGGHLLLGKASIGQHGFVGVFSNNGNLGMLVGRTQWPLFMLVKHHHK
jgi:hypothetical protein